MATEESREAEKNMVLPLSSESYPHDQMVAELGPWYNRCSDMSVYFYQNWPITFIHWSPTSLTQPLYLGCGAVIHACVLLPSLVPWHILVGPCSEAEPHALLGGGFQSCQNWAVTINLQKSCCWHKGEDQALEFQPVLKLTSQVLYLILKSKSCAEEYNTEFQAAQLFLSWGKMELQLWSLFSQVEKFCGFGFVCGFVLFLYNLVYRLTNSLQILRGSSFKLEFALHVFVVIYYLNT